MQGIGPPIVTPFDADGAIDTASVRTLVEALEADGVDFIVAGGSTSEAAILSPDECLLTVEAALEAASIPVVAGTGRAGYPQTLELTRRAADLGADAALVVTPYYYRHDRQALEAYYRQLADAVELPIYLYVIPRFAHHHLSADTVGRLAEHPNIAGIKDSRGDLGALVELIEATEDVPFDVLTGSAAILVDALDAGAAGAILALANVVPGRLAEIYRTHRDNRPRARSIHAELRALNATLLDAGIPGYKWAVDHRGLPGGDPRSPFAPLSADAAERLREELDTFLTD